MARARASLEQAVNAILLRHGANGKRLSLRQAERLTGLSPATVGELAKGNARTAETVRRFAQGMNEDVTRLLVLAGFPPQQSSSAALPAPVQPPSALTDSESALLVRLKTALMRLPPGPDRQLCLEHLRHTTLLLERFSEYTKDSTQTKEATNQEVIDEEGIR